jgi:hypothetical protein
MRVAASALAQKKSKIPVATREALYYKVIQMKERDQAEEHLRVIRSLMERATIYRAIAAPSALIGGALAVIVGGALYVATSRVVLSPVVESCIWLVVFVLTAAANTFFLWRDARRRGDVFVSAGMKVALKAILPSLLVATILTGAGLEASDVLSLIWCICYGLALLSTAHFAPRSMARLGWAFLMTGLAATVLVLDKRFAINAEAFMAVTFGLFHLIYAACTWPRRAGDAGSGQTP